MEKRIVLGNSLLDFKEIEYDEDDSDLSVDEEDPNEKD